MHVIALSSSISPRPQGLSILWKGERERLLEDMAQSLDGPTKFRIRLEVNRWWAFVDARPDILMLPEPQYVISRAVEAYFDHLNRQKKSSAYFHSALSWVKTYIRKAHAYGMCQSVPMSWPRWRPTAEQVLQARERRVKKSAAVPLKEDVEKLIAWLVARAQNWEDRTSEKGKSYHQQLLMHAAIVSLAWDLGLRASDIVEARLWQFKREENGGRATWFFFPFGKSEKRGVRQPDYIRIGLEASAKLEAYLRTREDYTLGDNTSMAPLVVGGWSIRRQVNPYLRPEDNAYSFWFVKGMSIDRLQDLFEQWALSALGRKDLTIHDLRRARFTYEVAEGKYSPLQLSKRYRATYQTIVKHYDRATA